MAEQQIFLFENGGSIPISPHQIKSYGVFPCSRKEISNFIEEWHYSKNMNGVISDYCFKLMDGNRLIGAMVFGKLAMANVWKKYAKKQEHLIELRRLCCIDNTPKNTESYFIGKALKLLKKNTQIKKVLSYSDLTYGHTGVIYKASNFKLIGETKPQKVIQYQGRLYHDKTIRTTYKGKLKPFALKIKNALESDDAEYISTKKKNIYMYILKGD